MGFTHSVAPRPNSFDAGRGWRVAYSFATMGPMATLLDAEELIEAGTDTPEETGGTPRYHVVLLNDDYHTDAYVVEMLARLFLLPPSVGFRHAVEVDTTGRSIVLTCERDHAEFARDQIHGYGRDPRIPACQGSMSAVVERAGEGQ